MTDSDWDVDQAFTNLWIRRISLWSVVDVRLQRSLPRWQHNTHTVRTP
jgi:hypothetical protein